MQYNKLIRDNIPEIIISKGGTPVTHVATAAEFEVKLLEKLAEEVQEFTESKSAEEMADIQEVLKALYEHYGLQAEVIEDLRWKKAAERGAFTKRLILEES
jgi:predicted house-cleaning noncanonical NTP pyrophosphatase (MazG superfamily)